MNFEKARTLVGVFIVAVALVTLASIFSFINYNRLLQYDQEVDETYQLLLTLQALDGALKDSESTQRAFLLTKREVFFRDYRQNYQEMNLLLQRVRAQSFDAAFDQQLDTLQSLILARQESLEERLRVENIPDSSDAFRLSLLLSGRELKARIVENIEDLKEDALQRLVEKEAALNENRFGREAVLVAFPVLALLIIGFAFWQVWQMFRKNQEYKQELEVKIEQLNTSNQELELFAYVASHDLQEPLRKVRAFGDILKNDYQDKLDEQGRNFIERMQNAAERMQTLITDLLGFSRASRNAGEQTLVNLNQLIRNILSDYETVIDDTNANINLSIPSTLNLEGVTSQLQQLFQNLISNGLKFSKPDEAPVLDIKASILPEEQVPADLGVAPASQYCQVIVRDHGIGFDEKYIDKIFTIFQRLHGRQEYSGTGIGLALCKKIAANHGGALTAKSTLGKGAEFKVVLPLKSIQNERPEK